MSEVLARIEERETHHGLKPPAPALHRGPIAVNYWSKQVRDGGSVRKRGQRDFWIPAWCNHCQRESGGDEEEKVSRPDSCRVKLPSLNCHRVAEKGIPLKP